MINFLKIWRVVGVVFVLSLFFFISKPQTVLATHIGACTTTDVGTPPGGDYVNYWCCDRECKACHNSCSNGIGSSCTCHQWCQYTQPAPTAPPNVPPPASTSAPTITPGPIACGQPCGPSVPGNRECDQACPICAPGSDGRHICQPPLQCNSPCVVNGAPGVAVCPTAGPRNNSGGAPQDCSVCVPGSTPGMGVCGPPSPTPRPAPSCNCDDTKITGTVAPGQTVTVTTWIKVATPRSNPAEVRNIQFQVYDNGRLIYPSGNISPTPVAVGAPIRMQDPKNPGTEIDRYSATFTYTIPATNTAGPHQYRFVSAAQCGWKPGTPGASSESSQSQGFIGSVFSSIGNFFGNLFGRSTPVPTAIPTQAPAPQAQVQSQVNPQVTIVGGQVDETALKLGTFHPADLLPTRTPTPVPATPTPTPRIEELCKEASVWLYY